MTFFGFTPLCGQRGPRELVSDAAAFAGATQFVRPDPHTHPPHQPGYVGG